MLPFLRNDHEIPVRHVKGEVKTNYYRYTVGIAGEKFFEGLKNGKLVATSCDDCTECGDGHVYLPPRMYCECCFAELTNYFEVPDEGTVVSFTEVYQDLEGHPLSEPVMIALINIDDTDTLFLHYLIETEEEPYVGLRVKAVWNDDRTGSLFDIKGYKPT